MNISAGDFARSKSGHDSGRIYVVVKVEEEVVYLCDGRLRCIDKPKKKNIKHIQVIKKMPAEIRQCCYQNEKFYNEGIKKAIKDYKNKTMTGGIKCQNQM